MSYIIKEYKINQEDSGRITLKLELEQCRIGGEHACFRTNEAIRLIVEDGYCESGKDLAVIKASIAYNWGGSQSKADWTFENKAFRQTKQFKKTVAKVEPAKVEPAKVEPAKNKKEPANKSKAKKKVVKSRTTQDILASISKKGK